jgi:hypothetical protein
MEANVFGFIEKRILKEHIKLVVQSDRALPYLSAFLPVALSERFSAISDVLQTWKPGTRLSDEQFMALWEINKQLRRAYDLSPARGAGMKPFDKEFQPMLGWEEYYSRYL